MNENAIKWRQWATEQAVQLCAHSKLYSNKTLSETVYEVMNMVSPQGQTDDATRAQFEAECG